MERLTMRDEEEKDLILPNGQSVIFARAVQIMKAFERLADYEDAEEQGLLVRLPCKVGGHVYTVGLHNVIRKFTVTSIYLTTTDSNIWCISRDETVKFNFRIEEFGTRVFLTKEEAEKALSEVNK